MKKHYFAPMADKIEFDYTETVIASEGGNDDHGDDGGGGGGGNGGSGCQCSWFWGWFSFFNFFKPKKKHWP